MRMMRILSVCCLFGSSTLIGFSANLDAQVSTQFGDTSTQSTSQSQTPYYQPLSKSEYERHVQTAYLESTGTGSTVDNSFGQQLKLTAPRPNDVEALANGEFDITQASLITKASLTTTQPVQENQALARQDGKFTRLRRANGVGFRRLRQDPPDPFGDSQVVPPPQDNQFGEIPQQLETPPQQDPFGEVQNLPNRLPPAQQQDPATEIPNQSLDMPPRQDDPSQDYKVDPFADPPQDDEIMIAPPESQDFEPGQIPSTPEDSQSIQRPELVRPGMSDIPPPDSSTQPDNSLEYFPGNAQQRPYFPNDGVYRAPSSQTMPPIVTPGQAIPFPGYAQPPVQSTPSFEAPYQPIPGVPQAQPDYVESIPGYYEPAPVQYTAPSVSSNLVPDRSNVYSSVVETPVETACNTCDNGCPNFYFSFLGGLGELRDLEHENDQGRISAESGTAFAIALGRRNGRNLRTEAEFSFRQNDVNGFTSHNPPANFPVTGELNSYSGMTNGYWEFIDVPSRCFKPYVGVGIGFVSIDAEFNNMLGQSVITNGADNDTSFAYQWMAGVNYKAYRNVDLFAEYRFFAADSFLVQTSVPGMSGSYDYETDNVIVGFRWKF